MRRLWPGLLAALVVAGCSRDAEQSQKQPPQQVCEPVRLTCGLIPLVEKPDAVRGLLIGEEAKLLAPVFEHAGVKVQTTLGGKFDIILIACGEMSEASCAKTEEHLSEDGVMAWIIDVRGVSVGRFRMMLKTFALPVVRFWMPGTSRWLLTGRRKSRQVALNAMLDIFSRDGLFTDLAKARCVTLPEVFASYVGSREDVVPAFALLDLSAEVRPENFITKDVRAIDWIAMKGTDDDIASTALADMRSMQVIRRLVVEGGLVASAATNKQEEERATSIWARAMLRNPNDPFLHERIDNLNRNARGFLEVGKLLQAMKCYETIIMFAPNDAAALHNFGMCLKKIGKRNLAEKALERARRLTEETETRKEKKR